MNTEQKKIVGDNIVENIMNVKLYCQCPFGQQEFTVQKVINFA